MRKWKKKKNDEAKPAVSYKPLITVQRFIVLLPQWKLASALALSAAFPASLTCPGSCNLPTCHHPRKVRFWDTCVSSGTTRSLLSFEQSYTFLTMAVTGDTLQILPPLILIAPNEEDCIIILISQKREARLKPCVQVIFLIPRPVLWTRGFQNVFPSAECWLGTEISRQPAQRSWLSKRGVKPGNLF